MLEYEPVYCVDFQWLPYAPNTFPLLAWQNIYWFSIFCVLYQEYEKYTLLINLWDRLYFCKIIISPVSSIKVKAKLTFLHFILIYFHGYQWRKSNRKTAVNDVKARWNRKRPWFQGRCQHISKSFATNTNKDRIQLVINSLLEENIIINKPTKYDLTSYFLIGN